MDEQTGVLLERLPVVPLFDVPAEGHRRLIVAQVVDHRDDAESHHGHDRAATDGVRGLLGLLRLGVLHQDLGSCSPRQRVGEVRLGTDVGGVPPDTAVLVPGNEPEADGLGKLARGRDAERDAGFG